MWIAITIDNVTMKLKRFTNVLREFISTFFKTSSGCSTSNHDRGTSIPGDFTVGITLRLISDHLLESK